jgi:hypothetical protein
VTDATYIRQLLSLTGAVTPNGLSQGSLITAVIKGYVRGYVKGQMDSSCI